MISEPIFKGVATALITPTTEAGVDYEVFGNLIDWQIEQGINALVIAGTTGEGSTLSDAEHREVLEFAIKRINGRVPAIAGTGSNDTAYAISLTKCAEELGYDGALVVTPYYNKATQNGLVAMYTAIADATNIPLILYNVPSRTGVAIEPSTYAKLADHPHIAAIKEANGNIGKLTETMHLVGDRLTVYSGNDDQIVPFLAMGAQGVISVLSNLMPAKTVEMCDLFFEGRIKDAALLQADFQPLCAALFCETNPIPARAAMAEMGWGENYLRLPLTPMEPQNWERLRAEMACWGLVD